MNKNIPKIWNELIESTPSNWRIILERDVQLNRNIAYIKDVPRSIFYSDDLSGCLNGLLAWIRENVEGVKSRSDIE
jgi:hypothetical protein